MDDAPSAASTPRADAEAPAAADEGAQERKGPESAEIEPVFERDAERAVQTVTTAAFSESSAGVELTEDEKQSVIFLEQAAGMMRSIVPPSVVAAEEERLQAEMRDALAAGELRSLEVAKAGLARSVDSITAASIMADHAAVSDAMDEMRAAEKAAKHAALRARLEERKRARQTPPAAPV